MGSRTAQSVDLAWFHVLTSLSPSLDAACCCENISLWMIRVMQFMLYRRRDKRVIFGAAKLHYCVTSAVRTILLIRYFRDDRVRWLLRSSEVYGTFILCKKIFIKLKNAYRMSRRSITPTSHLRIFSSILKQLLLLSEKIHLSHTHSIFFLQLVLLNAF